ALPCHEAAARAYLQHFGLADTSRHARDADQAVAQADALGYPVALKIVSADLPHKTEAGGVALQLGDADAVRNAYDRVVAAAARHAPRARRDGVLVQRMEQGGAELIGGATRDPVFGPVLTVGLGGVLTELYGDTSHRVLPIGLEEAGRMLRELKVFPLLDGYRGKPRADVAAACRAIVAVGDALLASP